MDAWQTQLLTHGFVRTIESQIYQSASYNYTIYQIPYCIKSLCYAFYSVYMNCNLLICVSTKKNANPEYTKMKLFNFISSTLYNIKIHYNLSNINNNNYSKDILCSGNQYTTPKISYQLLPNTVKYQLKCFKNDCNQHLKSYYLIFRIGGRNAYVSDSAYYNGVPYTSQLNICDMVLLESPSTNTTINTNNTLNGYYISLPSLTKPFSSSSLIYNKNMNQLISIGGYYDKIANKVQYIDNGNGAIYNNKRRVSRDTVQICNLNHLKWNICSNKLSIARSGSSVCLLNNSSIMVIGGNKLKSAEIFNIYNDENILLSNMKYYRYKSGCNIISKYNKIVVGGGVSNHNCDPNKIGNFILNNKLSSHQTVEIYDIIKDKWLLLGNKTNYPHSYNPVIWVDNKLNNPNIVCIAGDKGHFANTNLGCIEYLDMRVHDRKWNVLLLNNQKLNTYKIDQLFDISPEIFNIWERRQMFALP